MKIALTGNPNSGKTTMFNELTGSVEKVGNWHGVTVEKKVGKLKSKYNKKDLDIDIVDLPGAYSLNPYTSEEGVTKDFIKNESPDIIINIVESTNLKRSLFFTTQLLELGIPVIIALNKKDLLDIKQIKVNTQELSQILKCPVILTSGDLKENNGLDKLIAQASIISKMNIKQSAPNIEGVIEAKNEKQYSKVDKARQAFINDVVNIVVHKKLSTTEQTKQDKIDSIVAHKWLGIPIFVFVIYIIFVLSQSLIGPFIADYLVMLLEGFQEWVATLVDGASPVLSALLVDGIIGGVIAVVGFLPLIMVMFFLMALIEDMGYMARVAVVMDRFFKKIGLSGRCIIPMVISTACAIPGIMSARTIRDERQKRTTAMLAPFMPCGAKLPVIALFAGTFFSSSAIVATSMYFLAIIVILISAIIIRKITKDTSQSYFIMELPEYKVPSFKRAFNSMMSRAKAFIIKATTIILVCNAIVQLMQTYTWNLQVATNASDSILASISHPIAILLIPLGFGTWQFAAASVTGFIAKENVVGTLAVVFSISNLIDTEELEMVAGSASSIESAMSITAVAALSFLIFNLFTPPCFAAIGALRTELNDKRWLIGAIGFQFAVGYSLAFLTYQIGTLLTTGAFGSGFIPGLIVIVTIIMYITYLIKKPMEV